MATKNEVDHVIFEARRGASEELSDAGDQTVEDYRVVTQQRLLATLIVEIRAVNAKLNDVLSALDAK